MRPAQAALYGAICVSGAVCWQALTAHPPQLCRRISLFNACHLREKLLVGFSPSTSVTGPHISH
jgi:hypothetical protein